MFGASAHPFGDFVNLLCPAVSSFRVVLMIEMPRRADGSFLLDSYCNEFLA